MTNDGQGRYRLTRRERQVLQLICDGLAYKEIATGLEMSTNTVARYAASFLAAFQCRDREALRKFVAQQPNSIYRGMIESKAA
jgi:DNA-binding NarL/FixJ family response regulator